MKVPKSFLGRKNLDNKVKEFLNRTKRDLPGGLENESMTDKICRYLDISPYSIFYEKDRERIRDQVGYLNNKNYKALRTIDDEINKFEHTLKTCDIEWRLLSDEYTKTDYEANKKKVRDMFVSSPVLGYNVLVNYLPGKAANYFFEKGKKEYELPSGWETLGVLSYMTILAGEAVVVGSVLGPLVAGAFVLSALTAGVFKISVGEEYNLESFEYYLELVEDYNKIQENRALIESLKEEREMIVKLIKDYIKHEKPTFFSKV